MSLDQSRDVFLCKMPCSKTMLEPRSDGSREHPRQAAKLLNISETLEMGAINKFPDFFGKRDKAVDGVMNLPCAWNIFLFVVAEFVHKI